MRLAGLQYDSPNAFTLKQRLILAVAPPVTTSICRALMATCRVETRGQDYFDGAMAEHGRVILGVWHECIPLAAWTYRGRNYHTTTSYSFDGELAARMVHHFGCEAVRGSSSRGGSNSLLQLQKALDLVPCVAFTLDGPRGPRRVSKPGAAILCARVGVPIIPHAFAYSACWRFRSWDRMAVPKPFSRIISAYGEPIAPPPSDTREYMDATRLKLQDALNALHRTLEEEVDDIQLLDG